MFRARQLSARILRAAANRMDLQLPGTDLPPTSEREKFFYRLHRLGFTPKHVVDVGANLGNWTRNCRKYFPQAYYTLLEPQIGLKDQMADLLREPRVNLHTVGAAAIDGDLSFTVHDRHDSRSFVYSAEDATRLGYEQIRVPVVRLDTLLKSSSLPVADMIKIDAEGFDLEVIRGGRETISKADVLLLEVRMMSKRGFNSLLDVVGELDQLEFCPFDITEFIRTQKSQALWLIEMAFVNKNGWIDRRISTHDS
jgi:FkbM family methyltransferase